VRNVRARRGVEVRLIVRGLLTGIRRGCVPPLPVPGPGDHAFNVAGSADIYLAVFNRSLRPVILSA
jgi:hypothetical protein